MFKPYSIKVKIEGPSDTGLFVATSPELIELLATAQSYDSIFFKIEEAIEDLHKVLGYEIEIVRAGCSDMWQFYAIFPLEDKRIERIKEIYGLDIWGLGEGEASDHVRYNLEGVIYEGTHDWHNCHLDDGALKTLDRIANQLAEIERVLEGPKPKLEDE